MTVGEMLKQKGWSHDPNRTTRTKHGEWRSPYDHQWHTLSEALEIEYERILEKEM